MSTTPAEQVSSVRPVPEATRTRGVLAFSSFVFALLQSICGAAVAINGFRIAIGIGALVFTSGAGAAMVRFHADWIRIPMISIALVGSLVNVAILIHVRRLRNRPAAQWRRRVLTNHEVRMERLQWALSVAALVLIGIEEYLHFNFHHTL
ncbi:MAG TPA: hypothetical protein VMA71_08010 [Alloacidobacterium sp.]|nr:hypothetical protein [Alloacidobacterium sp.]